MIANDPNEYLQRIKSSIMAEENQEKIMTFSGENYGENHSFGSIDTNLIFYLQKMIENIVDKMLEDRLNQKLQPMMEDIYSNKEVLKSVIREVMQDLFK